jgi:tetratricopeptide (TPR) repeat protein
MITSTQKDYRKTHPEVFTLGGITKIRGLVYDRENKDTILVGERDPERAILTLDDFVVALRARFIHGKWPLVSIDPTEETEKTNMQIVRFEGGIENTQFGQDFFDADYRLKRIGMGLLPSGIPGFKTYWDLGMERAKRGIWRTYNIYSRVWFYPIIPCVPVKDDVAAIRGLKVGVFTEVLSAEIDGKKIEDLSTFRDETGDMFAKAVSDNFDRLAKVHPSFLRLQGLSELLAFTHAIENMEKIPDFSFWLKEYKVKRVSTKKEVEVLKRKEEYRVERRGMIYSGYWEVSGGVQLMAIALRLKAGDVTALKEAVLKTRPKPDTLSWSFVVAEWLIPTTPGMLKMEDIASLFTHAVFLQVQKRYDDALTLYGKIIELKPDWEWAYNNRGVTYGKKGLPDKAIEDYNKALEINPRYAEAYNNRGNAYFDKGLYDRAIEDYNKALEINPRYAGAYNNRGNAYFDKGLYDRAIEDYNKALEINPRYAQAY